MSQKLLPCATTAALLVLMGCTRPSPVVEDPIPAFELAQPELLSTPGTLTNAWADFDSDGDPDLFIGFTGGPNRLYRNDGGILVEVAGEFGVADARGTRTSAWGDFDGDGDPDLLLGFAAGEGPVTRLYRNDGDTFTDVAEDSGLQLTEGTTRQAAWVDFDSDGDLDLFLGLRDRPNALFLNEGGTFRDIAPQVGLADPRRTVGAVWFDADQDGDLDLVVANMNGDANGFFRNDHGVFVDVAGEAGLADGGRGLEDDAHGSVRPCVVDYDNDGSFELFFANYGPNSLFKRNLAGQWTNLAWDLGLAIDAFYDTCEFGDFDQDGRVDLFVNGTVTGGVQYRDYLFRNTPSGFHDVTPDGLLALDADHGVRWVDFDGDGDLDLSLTGATDSGMHHLLRNNTSPVGGKSSVLVQVTDSDGRATRAGAEVRIYRAGTRDLLGTRLLDTGSGYDAQSVLPVHFGIPQQVLVDIEVLFPGAGSRSITRVENVDPSRLTGRLVTVTLPG
jgi:hypothetical protein